VDYFGKGARADRVIYGADVVGGAVTNAIVYPLASEPLLKQPALQMTKALLAAKGELLRHADWHPCQSAPFNSIVLPPDERGTIPVYFLTPQTQAASFPFGGHYEVEVAADGKVTFSRAFTRSCVELTKPAPNSGATPAALFITHLLDSHPTEIHVFEQYYVGLPVFVGTGPKTVWKVQNGVIADVSASMSR
jgi:hypothetical protein